MRNLAVIPARSGSKGLKDKNIKELLGKPLLAYSIEAALQSEVLKGLIGQVMKLSKGKANPGMVTELMTQKLSNL